MAVLTPRGARSHDPRSAVEAAPPVKAGDTLVDLCLVAPGDRAGIERFDELVEEMYAR